MAVGEIESKSIESLAKTNYDLSAPSRKIRAETDAQQNHPTEIYLTSWENTQACNLQRQLLSFHTFEGEISSLSSRSAEQDPVTGLCFGDSKIQRLYIECVRHLIANSFPLIGFSDLAVLVVGAGRDI